MRHFDGAAVHDDVAVGVQRVGVARADFHLQVSAVHGNGRRAVGAALPRGVDAVVRAVYVNLAAVDFHAGGFDSLGALYLKRSVVDSHKGRALNSVALRIYRKGAIRDVDVAEGVVLVVFAVQAVLLRRDREGAAADRDGVVRLEAVEGGIEDVCAAGHRQVVLAGDAVPLCGLDTKRSFSVKCDIVPRVDDRVGVGFTVRAECAGDGEGVYGLRRGDEAFVGFHNVNCRKIRIRDAHPVKDELHLAVRVIKVDPDGAVACRAGYEVGARRGDVDDLPVGNGQTRRVSQVGGLLEVPFRESRIGVERFV